MSERISVIIPSYNYARFLPFTLRNILAQRDVDTEIIVVDDGSTDDTEQVAAAFGKKIRYVRQFNQGVSAARNVGMALAQGEYIMFLDSDDLMMPGALRSQLDCLKAHPEADIVRCATDFCTAPTPEAAPQPLHCKPFFFFKDSEAVHLCAMNFLPMHSLLLRRKVIEKVNKFDESLPTHEDHDYWFRCVLAGFTFCRNRKVLALYRRHAHNASSQLTQHFLGEAMVRRHIAELFAAHPEAMAGERLEALLAIAAGHLITLLVLYEEPEACLELRYLALQALQAAAAEHRKSQQNTDKRLGLLRTVYLLRIAEALEGLRQGQCPWLAPFYALVAQIMPYFPVSGEGYKKNRAIIPQQVLWLPPRLTDLSMVEPFASDAAQRAADQTAPACHDVPATENAAALTHPVKISVVIATFNAEQYLERAIVSVLGQSWPHVELLVQDGGSTDGTASIVRRHSTRIAHFETTPDKGVYDAWNKALPHVSGDWVIFLGADDFFADADVLTHCAEHLARVDDAVLFAYGSLVMVKEDVPVLTLDRSLSEVLHLFTADMGLPFPATFTRASFLKRQGFDASYRIAGDFAMAAGAVTRERLHRLPVHVCYMASGSGLSTGAANRQLLAAERARVLKEIVLPRAAEIVAGGARSSLMRE